MRKVRIWDIELCGGIGLRWPTPINSERGRSRRDVQIQIKMLSCQYTGTINICCTFYVFGIIIILFKTIFSNMVGLSEIKIITV